MSGINRLVDYRESGAVGHEPTFRRGLTLVAAQHEPVTRPQFLAHRSGVFERIFTEFTTKPTKAEKRARTSIQEAIQTEHKAKRAR